MVSGFAIRNEPDNKDRNSEEQQYVDVTAFMQNKLQHQPNNQDYRTNYPHIKIS